MGKLGLKESVSMGVGAMIGGGIFSVLGVAINLAGRAVILTYFIGGIIALASGYSFAKLTLSINDEGGSFTFLEHFMDNNRLAAMVGWVLILGYVGSVAMYAYTFGAFAASLLEKILPFSQGTIGTVVSIAVLLAFLYINLRGVESSSTSEFYMVVFKVIILLLVSVIGLLAIIFQPSSTSQAPDAFFNEGILSPILAIGVIFVSYQGFQLLTYEYKEIENREENIMKGIIYSILISVFVYIFLSYVTSTLLPAKLILEKKETALAYVLFEVFSNSVIKNIFFYVIVGAALASTASAINATLFGTARLAAKIANRGDLPKIFSFKKKSDIPVQSLYIITGFTILLAALGTLEQITSFASISFLIVFSVVNLIMIIKDPDERKYIPYIGFLGTSIAIILYFVEMLRKNPFELVFTGGTYVILYLLDVLYFHVKER